MAAEENNSNQTGLISSAIFNFDHLEPQVQTHLKNTYGCLSLGMMSASLGAYVHLITNLEEWSVFSTFASFGMLLWLAMTRHTKENVVSRLGIFNAFTFLSGASMGPLLDLVVSIEPRIVSTALLSSAIVFISLTLAALLSFDRKFIYMGGLLFSCMFLLMFVGFMNTFLASRIVFDIYVYCSLGLFITFVLYDTQLIVEKRRRGDEDFIWHAAALFLDALQIFKLLLIILAKKERSKNRTQDS